MPDRREVVVSGMRPTGRLHLGNYWGALKNWIALTRSYDCYFFVADWHMLTTGYSDTGSLQANVREMVLDWLAAGLDPAQCVIFKQSDVPEHAELALLLGMVTPLSWLENNPTWKEQLQELAKTKLSKAVAGEEHAAEEGGGASRYEIRTFGFLGYPVLQAADILLYRGERVPVGQDQLPHVELSREIARKFNSVYGHVLPEPQPLLTRTPKVPGTDGRKMSKSYGNTLDIRETPESLKAKIMSMYTDPKKVRANDPGHPDPGPDNPPGCVVYALHKLYTPGWEKIGEDCRAGRLGCVADKKNLIQSVERPFADFCRAREGYAASPGRIEEILAEGARKARPVAQATLQEVRRAMRVL
ncbi:MAG TPA: tryptophan--tRNA ligase [Elusimicrobia bacterium]|nr:tryptophan--tRNA ligase [Elusimicrobiota bacterium]HBT60470.1 tryptophan--tRNA ligase [Elusimicrobiota bacterium]